MSSSSSNKNNIEFFKSLGITEIDSNRRYWLVRANAGAYFDDFILEGYIGLSWNKINNLDYFSLNQNDLKEKISLNYPDEKSPGNIAGQILKFANEIKKGDIVLIPSENSKHIAFAKVLETCPYIEDENSETDLFNSLLDEIFEDSETAPIQPCLIRKKIVLLHTFRRDQVDIYIYPLLHSHHTITSADIYGHYIDRMLNYFYIKNDKAHLILKVTKKHDIQAVELIKALTDIINLSEVFESHIDQMYKKENIDIKLNVQSPGPIEFISPAWAILIGLGMLLGALNGGKHKIMFGNHFVYESESDGLIANVIKYINAVRANSNLEGITTLDEEQVKKLVSDAINSSQQIGITPNAVNTELEQTADVFTVNCDEAVDLV